MDEKGASSGAEWDRVAGDYNRFATRFTSLHAFDLLSSISDQIRSAKTVLDVACGTGATCIAYLKLFPKGIPGQTFIMTDISPQMVSIAEQQIRSNLPSDFETQLQFRAEDGCDIKSISDSTVDVLLSCFGVFLIPNRDAMFKEVKRVLKPGGTFGTTAWTDLPAEMDFKTHGFGAEFQATVGAAFGKLSVPDPSAKPPPWKAWSDPDVVRKILNDESFAKIKIHRTVHTTTFRNIEVLWYAITRTCPFVDVSKMEPSTLEDVRKTLWDGMEVENEDDIVYVVMSSNIVVAVV